MKARMPLGRERPPRHRCQVCDGVLPLRHYRLIVDGALWRLCAADYRSVMQGRVQPCSG